MMMGGGGYAGGGGYGGRGGGMYGTYGGTTGVVVGEGVGRMMMVGPWNGVSAVSNTVVTIQVTKADVDAYAKGELNDEQFRQRVKTFVY